jgi:hypothetical protein
MRGELKKPKNVEEEEEAKTHTEASVSQSETAAQLIRRWQLNLCWTTGRTHLKIDRLH